MVREKGVMRLWYLADARLPGEAANTVQIMKMCAAFAACGCRVRLLARPSRLTNDGSLHRAYAVPNTFEIARSPRLVPGRSHRDLWNIPFTLSALPYLRWNQRSFDLVYTRVPWLASWAARLGMNVVFEAHRPLPCSGSLAMRFGTQFVKNAAGPRFRALVAISEALANLYRPLGVPAGKILVAHDGVDLERFTPTLSKQDARKRLRLDSDQPIVCYAGHLYAGRGTSELLECARRMPEVLYLFVGGSTRDLEKFQSGPGAEDRRNVRFIGFQPNSDLPAYLFAADVLAMPYTTKTGSAQYMSPMKMFEYMAAERPIVATNFPSVREVLAHERNAVLVEPDSVDALAAGIRSALVPGCGAKLGVQARLDVSEYSWIRRAKRILQFVGSTSR